ncbi:hypothetical protein ACRQQF_25965, partial [Citrobacter arsenatis]|uniref:hypothetical protein n=1 Tax=Citrobacter arsenatis TaxID=2546350 RepID=UPI003D7F8B99
MIHRRFPDAKSRLVYRIYRWMACLMEAQDIALYPMVRCCDVPDALRLSGLQNTFSPASVGRIRRHAASGGFHPAQTQKSPSVRMGFFTLFDAWQ